MPKKLLKIRVFVKLGLARKSVDSKITQGNAICASISAASSTFTTPDPTVASLQSSVDNLLSAKNAAANGGQTEKDNVLSMEFAYDIMVSRMGDYVQSIADTMSNGADRAAVIHSAGMDTRKTPEPRPIPDPVAKVQAIFTNDAGVIDVKWKGTKNVKYYKVFISTNSTDWTLKATTSKLRITFSGLESGTRYYFRIISAGTRGESEPSAIATTIAA